MSQQVVTFSISAPGFAGLNLQDSPVDLPANWALEANNCIIDKSGRVAARKGWTKAHSSSNSDLSTSNVTCIGELVQTDGTATTVCTGGAFLFKLASATTLTTLTYGGGGVAPTISASNWQFCFLNGVAMFWQAAGKPPKSLVRLEARQEGDHIVLIIADDGKGMNAERIRAKATEKGLISEEEANTLDERQSLNLIFMPGFSTKTQISDVSGRGVGMDVVKTNIQKLNGSIEIRSEPGKGSVFIISLPLTLAILPVLLVLLGDQPFALPLSLVREILPIEQNRIQEVGGKETLVVRGEVLPVITLARLLGWPLERYPEYGVFMQTAERSFILAVDSFAGRDDAVIKSLEDFRPKGVAGVTTLSNGQIVLILDMKELLTDLGQHPDIGSGVRALDFA